MYIALELSHKKLLKVLVYLKRKGGVSVENNSLHQSDLIFILKKHQSTSSSGFAVQINITSAASLDGMCLQPSCRPSYSPLQCYLE